MHEHIKLSILAWGYFSNKHTKNLKPSFCIIFLFCLSKKRGSAILSFSRSVFQVIFLIHQISFYSFFLFSGHYMVATPHVLNGEEESAILESRDYKPTNGNCFTFWYFKKDSTSSLEIMVSRNGTLGTPYKINGRTRNWRPLRVNIQSDVEYKVNI